MSLRDIDLITFDLNKRRKYIKKNKSKVQKSDSLRHADMTHVYIRKMCVDEKFVQKYMIATFHLSF